MDTPFAGVYASSTVGTLLREFTFGHARQLESVSREHLVALCGRTELLPGADTKIAGKQILCKGLSPLATTISTPGSAPVITGCGRAPDGPTPPKSPHG